MSRLRGFLAGGPEGPSWDDVEETLIAGDVGAALAIDVVERARRRRDPAGAEAAVRAELAALLVPTRAGLGAQAVGRGRTGRRSSSSASTAPARRRRIGKLASRYAGEGHRVILAAADTFRAAAIDQLRDLGGPCRHAGWSRTRPARTRARSSTTRSTRPWRAARTS